MELLLRTPGLAEGLLLTRLAHQNLLKNFSQTEFLSHWSGRGQDLHKGILFLKGSA